MVDPVSNPSTRKLITAQTHEAASERVRFGDDDPFEEKVDDLEEKKCSAI